MDIKTASSLHRLRLVSAPEAVSFLLLLVCSVLKRTTDFDAVPVMGMVHGVLFILYVSSGRTPGGRAKWHLKTAALYFVLSVLPTGGFFAERKLKRAGRERGHRLARPPRRYGERMIVAFSVTPLGVGEDVGEYVADAVRVVRESGLPNHTDAMFTSIEGEWDEVMDVVKRAVAAVEARAPRVSLVLKADIRPGVTDGLTSKVETVERHLADDGRAQR